MAAKIEFNNPDGSSNAYTLFEPKQVSNTLMVVSPAMGVDASYYTALAENLSQYYSVATVDLRGHGFSSVRPSNNVNFGYKEMLLQDFHSSIVNLNTKFPNHRIVVLGHSLGGQMACLYASRFPENIDALILTACCSVYYKGWVGLNGYKTLISTQFAGLVASLVGYFPGKKLGFAGLEAKNVMQDWSYQSRTGNYVVQNDDFNYESALSELKQNVLVISFESDTYAPKEAVENLYQKLNSTSSIEHIHLLESDPRNDRFSHFNWAKKPDNIVEIIRNWSVNLD